MAWNWTGNKSLPEPTMIRLTEANMRLLWPRILTEISHSSIGTQTISIMALMKAWNEGISTMQWCGRSLSTVFRGNSNGARGNGRHGRGDCIDGGMNLDEKQCSAHSHDHVYNQSGHGPLARYVKLRVAHAPGMLGTFFRHQVQRKPLFSHPGMHHGTCVTHVPWCMSGSLSRGGGKNVAGIPGACVTRDFTYLARGPWNPTTQSHRVISEIDIDGHKCIDNRRQFITQTLQYRDGWDWYTCSWQPIQYPSHWGALIRCNLYCDWYEWTKWCKMRFHWDSNIGVLPLISNWYGDEKSWQGFVRMLQWNTIVYYKWQIRSR